MAYNRFCFGCNGQLTYISNRRLMCFSCEKIYAEEYVCRQCSAQSKTTVHMEVTFPGKVRCILCGREKDAPGLNLETALGRETLARIRRTSIPPRTSTCPGRISGLVGTAQGLRTQNLTERQGGPSSNKPFRPRPVMSKKDTSSRVTGFLERSEPDRIEEEGKFVVIVEFPRHRREDIACRVENGMLVIKSMLKGCPYRNELALPKGAGEPCDIHFQNGILEITFVVNHVGYSSLL